MARRGTPPLSTEIDSQHKRNISTLLQSSPDLIGIQLHDCMHCSRCKNRTSSFGVGKGNPHADLVFVDESGDKQEGLTDSSLIDAFLDNAILSKEGQLLDRMIQAIGLRRDQIFIAKLVKSQSLEPTKEPTKIRPEETPKGTPEGAAPPPGEALIQIQPKIIVTLGNTSTQTLLQSSQDIAELRGIFYPQCENATPRNEFQAGVLPPARIGSPR